MDKTTASILNYLIVAAFVLGVLALVSMNTLARDRSSIKFDCKADIKWEDYSCLVGNEHYVSCPHPTHIECSGDIPLRFIDKYTTD